MALELSVTRRLVPERLRLVKARGKAPFAVRFGWIKCTPVDVAEHADGVALELGGREGLRHKMRVEIRRGWR